MDELLSFSVEDVSVESVEVADTVVVRVGVRIPSESAAARHWVVEG
ncbi:hypothetical protein [Streptomyces microflavus]|uniref:Uncharacterized protein n=1 Tax=Streptomyces microflavus TaxID=1919 RepID=A0A7H8N0H7_STRMI|nr:hypothetical protein [Streptomyces microflavus]QKW47975.1 hypothetical protein HUT09_36350 [Streptomyces microflavus]